MEGVIGAKFNRLTVLSHDSCRSVGKRQYYICQCECRGKDSIKSVRLDCLKNGNTKSCGCAHKDKKNLQNIKHGLKGTRIYDIWCDMKKRCYNPKNHKYKDYGGRGIKVCDEWLNNPKTFYDWSMENGYEDHLTIDRINNDGNYCPLNCRWTTRKNQCRNRRGTRMVTINNKTIPFYDAVDKYDILCLGRDCLRQRIFTNGWDVDKAFNTPKRARAKHVS